MDRAKWDHPFSSTIRTREFIVLGGGQPLARGRGLALDRRVDEIPLYADEDRAQVEASEHVLIRQGLPSCRSAVPTVSRFHHEPVNGAGAVHFPYGRSIQKNAGARDVALKSTLYALATEVPKRAGEFGTARGTMRLATRFQ